MKNTDARNPDAVTASTPYGTEAGINLEGPRGSYTVYNQAYYRIEALRAASRVVAGVNPTISKPGHHKIILADTIDLAEQFARWLETGER